MKCDIPFLVGCCTFFALWTREGKYTVLEDLRGFCMNDKKYKFIYSKVLLKTLLDKGLINDDEFKKAIENLKLI